MENLKNIYHPKDLNEAVKLLKKPKTQIIAGGTSNVFIKRNDIESLVDVTKLPLSYIKRKNNKIYIGATTTLSEIYKSDILKSPAGKLLCEVAGSTASTPLRNVITVGGNIVQNFRWSSMPLAMMVLNAELKFKGKILTEVIIDDSATNVRTAYEKIVRTKTDFHALAVAVWCKFKKELIEDIRIAVAGASLRPVRLTELENVIPQRGHLVAELETKDLASTSSATTKQHPELVEGFSMTENVNIVGDIIFSKEYKKEVLPVLVKRALQKIITN